MNVAEILGNSWRDKLPLYSFSFPFFYFLKLFTHYSTTQYKPISLFPSTAHNFSLQFKFIDHKPNPQLKNPLSKFLLRPGHSFFSFSYHLFFPIFPIWFLSLCVFITCVFLRWVLGCFVLFWYCQKQRMYKFYGNLICPPSSFSF